MWLLQEVFNNSGRGLSQDLKGFDAYIDRAYPKCWHQRRMFSLADDSVGEILLVGPRYCEKHHQGRQWPKMTIIKAELTRAQRTRMRHFGGGQCQSRRVLKMEQKHNVTIVTSHTGLSGKGQCQLAQCQPFF